jgi:DNA-binding NtrC family response regulator
LFIDDEPRFGQTAAKILERMGYRVTAFESSVEALEAFRAAPHEFDIVISDVVMPKMTGEALTAEIKKIRSDLPVLLCTGYSDGRTCETAKAAGADELLVKPVDWSQLSKILQSHLVGKETTQ